MCSKCQTAILIIYLVANYFSDRKADPQQNYANNWSQIASRTSWIQSWSQHCEPSRLVNWRHRKLLSNPAASWTSASRPLGCLQYRLAQRINPQATQQDSKQAHGKVNHAACNESPIRPPYWSNKVFSRRLLKNGVLQGSVLAPFLFNMYTPDLPATTSKKYVCADGIALATASRNFDVLETTLSKDLEELSHYFRNWQLKLNTSKTVTSVFHLDNRPAARTPLNIKCNGQDTSTENQPKYLGVTLDRTLWHSYKCHIKQTNRSQSSSQEQPAKQTSMERNGQLASLPFEHRHSPTHLLNTALPVGAEVPRWRS